MSNDVGANEAAIYELVEYIKANIPELNSVYLEFPNHNEPLNMPCASILTVGNPQYTNQMPELQKNEEGLSYYIVGHYDISMTIDLWTEYKQTRGDLMERVFDTFNKQFQELGTALGISLPMTKHHNAIARYDLNGYTYVDGEDGSQRDEWRVKMDILVNYPRVMAKPESKMEEITLDNDISDTDGSDTQESITIE